MVSLYFLIFGYATIAFAQDGLNSLREDNQPPKLAEYFVSREDGFYLAPSSVVAKDVTEEACLSVCLMNPSCFAVDYDFQSRSCYDHSKESYCELDLMRPATYRVHYRRVPCVRSENGDLEVGFSSLYQQQRVNGGRLACSSCNVAFCMSLCRDSVECRSIDYSYDQRMCFRHFRDTPCLDLVRTDNVGYLHAEKESCAFDIDTEDNSATMEAGIAITEPPPIMNMSSETALTGMIGKMEGFRISGGAIRFGNVTERRCAMLCAQQVSSQFTCNAADYNLVTNVCFLHSSENACNPLEPNLMYNHHRRVECEETVIDYCAATSCLNGGTCRNVLATYQCDCGPRYTGRNCETELDPCDSSPCENGATCASADDEFVCECAAGYTGTTCDQEINECDPNPCVNGATCVDEINDYRCNCLVGFDGINCQNNIDDCANSPCQNGAQCMDAVNDYFCACLPGYEGTNCQTKIDRCVANPCGDRGTCVDGTTAHTCQCLAGYIGTNCETDIDECDPDPCENGATCVDGINAYTCECAAGFEGVICQIDIDDCNPGHCRNGGLCEDGINTYTCVCVEGFTGNDCQIDIDDCVDTPCQNGGNCTDGVNAFTCTCEEGYEGELCQTITDDCRDDPCGGRGRCMDLDADFMCDCDAGYTGKSCQTDIDDCVEDPCENGAVCVDILNGYECNCVPGYEGVNCETNTNECLSEPCENGATCNDMINGYYCTCAAGFIGDHCETNFDDCASMPCQNEGVCLDDINGFNCGCFAGFVGLQCEINEDDCAGDPCINGGTCTDGIAEYNCQCLEGFTGQQCEYNIDECEANPCENNGTCMDLVNMYTCMCLPGYTGIDCETDIDECSEGPCQNGGLCVDEVNRFLCVCPSGYEGLTCDTETNECAPNPCQNLGICEDLVNGYNCTCSPGYVGDNCEISMLTAWPDTCVSGGILNRSLTTAESCMEACMASDECFAVDFDMVDNDCLLHTTLTFCSEREHCPGKIHYLFVPCLPGVTADDQMRYVRRSYSVTGGQVVSDRNCPRCSPDMCLSICYFQDDCEAVDFNMATLRCSLHTSNTVCNPIEPEPNTVHYTREICENQKTIAPRGSFAAGNLPAPTSISPGWQAYPGRFQIGGRQYEMPNRGATHMYTGDQCLSLCEDDERCLAVDYNSNDGTCYAHWTEERKCGPLLDNPEIYHVKRPGRCEFIFNEEGETSMPYPEPDLVGVERE